MSYRAYYDDRDVITCVTLSDKSAGGPQGAHLRRL